MILTVEQLYQLYYGGEHITNEFLHDLAPGEPESSRALRYDKAGYMNIVALAIDTYQGYIFSNPAKPTEVAFYDLLPALKRVTFHSMLGGACLIICLEDDPQPKIFDRRAYKETKNGFEISVTENGKDGRWIVEQDRIIVEVKGAKVPEYKRNADSVVEAFWNEAKVSLVRDVAPYAVKIFNYDSIADRQADNSAMWISSGGALAAGKKSVTPFMHFTRGNNDSPTPGFHSPPSDTIDKIDARIEKFIIRAGKTVGLQKEFADFYAVTSGAGQEMQMVSTNAITLQIASSSVQALNRAAAGGAALKAGRKGGEIFLSPALTPQAKSALLRQLTEGAQVINTPEAAEAYAVEIIKATLHGAPADSLKKAIDSVKGKGLEAIRVEALKMF